MILFTDIDTYSYRNITQQRVSKRLDDLQHNNKYITSTLIKLKEVQKHNVNLSHCRRECDVIKEKFGDCRNENTKNTSSKPLFSSFASLLEYQGPLQNLYHEASLEQNLNPIVETHPVIVSSQHSSIIVTSVQQKQLNVLAGGLTEHENGKGSQSLRRKHFVKYSTINLGDIFPCRDNAPTYHADLGSDELMTSLLNGKNDELMATLRQHQKELIKGK